MKTVFRITKPPPSELLESYKRLGSVHKVGKEYGIPGGTVHARLVKAGLFVSPAPEFSEAQKALIRSYYQNTPPGQFDLTALAVSIGKSKQNICRFAKREGLTNQGRRLSDRHIALMSETTKDQWKNMPHPRGMAGKKHTEEVKAVIGEKSKITWATSKTFGISLMAPDVREARRNRMALIAVNRPASQNYTRTKGGHREDLGGIYFRSSWEANYARYLNLMKRMGIVSDWQYEPETFWFEKIKRGVRSYRPDFKVNYVGISRPSYQEIKGWMDAKSKTKIRRFAKYYPEHDLTVIGAKEYREISVKWKSSIPNWEGK